jgi:hypothetical protein
MITPMRCPQCNYTYSVDWPEPKYEHCPMCGKHGPMSIFVVNK